MGADELGGGHDALRIVQCGPHGDVLADRAGEELAFLGHAADLAAQLRRRDALDVVIVDQDAPAVRGVEPLDQLGQGALARARGAHDPQDGAGLDLQIELLERRPGGIRIGEADRFEDDGALERGNRRHVAGPALGRLVEQLLDAAEGAAHLMQLVPGADHLAHRRDRPGAEDAGGDQRADRDLAFDHAQGADIDQAETDQVLQHRAGDAQHVGGVARLEAGPG